MRQLLDATFYGCDASHGRLGLGGLLGVTERLEDGQDFIVRDEAASVFHLVAVNGYCHFTSFWRQVIVGTGELATFPATSTQAKTWGAHGPIDPADWIGTLSIEFRVADTQAGLASASFSPLLTLSIAARWLQLRITVETSDPAWSPRLDYLFLTAEVVP